MKTVQFKTNIKCSGCVSKVTGELNNTAGADNWEVDLNSPERILSVKGSEARAEKIREAVERAGFKAEEIQ